MFKNFNSKLKTLNAPQLTVLSFFIISIISAHMLMIAEKETVFQNARPYLDNVELIHLDQKSYEEHTFIEFHSQKGIGFVDAWFTTISALCVTGLTSIDFSSFSLTGQILVMVLIQMGGLGIIVFTSILALSFFRGLSDRVSLNKILSQVMDTTHNEVVDMLKYVTLYTLIFELGATLIMGIYLSTRDPQLIDNINPWFWSLFHSISAFNNAGFGLLSNNLVNFKSDIVINGVIASLIVAGGMGYPVLIAFHSFLRSKLFNNNKDTKNTIALKEDVAGVATSLQIRVAIWGTIILIAAGSIVIFAIERTNSLNGETDFLTQVTASIFHSVSARTAGFNTIDIGAMHFASIAFIIILMFIGANPAGTAGGIKIPTVAVLYGYIKDWFNKPGQPVILLGRRVSKFAVSHAVRLLFFSLIFVFLMIFGISIAEGDYLKTLDSTFNLEKVSFEVFSAFGTVGLSMGFRGGVTSFSGILSEFSKILIILTMFVGRIGPLTMLQSLPFKHPQAQDPISPDFENSDRIQIG